MKRTNRIQLFSLVAAFLVFAVFALSGHHGQASIIDAGQFANASMAMLPLVGLNMNTAGARIIDPVLTNVAQGFRHASHVGMTLFPRVPVLQRGGQIVEFGAESFRRYNLRRAPGTATKRIQFGYLGKPFALKQDALEVPVPREHMQDASRAPGIDLGTRATRLGMNTLSLALEDDQAKIATNAANYDANHKVALAGADKWSDPAGTPSADIKDAREAVRASVGIYPNVALLSASAFEAARDNPAIVERFKYVSKDSITADMLAQLWGLERVVVGEAVVFDDAGNVDVWGNNAIVAYAPQTPNSMEEPSYGYTYTLEGNPLVEQPYWDNTAKSWIYPATYERDPVLSGMLAGFLIQNPA